jgi:hypothetical protein
MVTSDVADEDDGRRERRQDATSVRAAPGARHRRAAIRGLVQALASL